MGKSINKKGERNKELGKGIYQLKNGRYSSRFTGIDAKGNKKRYEKHFDTLREAKEWRDEQMYLSAHGGIPVTDSSKVNDWFYYWIERIKSPSVRANTLRNFCERYERNIKPVMANVKLKDVSPLLCQEVLARMKEQNYAASTIKMVWLTMYQLFEAAKDNSMMASNPMDSKTVERPKEKDIKLEQKKKMQALTIGEMRKFLEVAEESSCYPQFRVALETGMRTGELIGLKWEDVDFKERTISIKRTLEYRHSTKEWHIGPPKTSSSERVIPMSQVCYNILSELYKNRHRIPINFNYKEIFVVYRSDKNRVKEKVDVSPREFVFLNRKGLPTKNSAYDTTLYKLCDKAGIRRISMHILRHTYVTRALEAGMDLKDVSERAGHSNTSITIERYADVLEEQRIKNTDMFEKYMSECIGL